eukprot:TRINITY_DN20173_c0_g1_i1.p1 TRINITY_DN20173_c0_g1~~TRINITY_DN20173_c0_g1_i1.p1  ORF type:complete len:285 (-),score=68.85 TRINITY_DN20173_c0_g1_i1:295-1149(-)
MDVSPDGTVTLRNGVKLPVYGLGLSHNGGFSPEAVTASLDAGVRLFDTAARYRTEAPLAEALALRPDIQRKDLFLTTKLWPGDADDVESALEKSLERLNTDYVDLYLVHWPGSWDGGHESRAQAAARRQATWRSMEAVLHSGKARSIGVSNFMPEHLQDLAESCTVMPMVNQIEFNAFQQAEAVCAACKELDVIVQGYSPLAKASSLRSPQLLAIAQAAAASPAQVLIRWSLQRGVPVIPKTTNPQRVAENLGVFDFELSSEHMSVLDGLDCDMRVTWDPRGVV